MSDQNKEFLKPNFQLVAHHLSEKEEYQKYKAWFRANVDRLKEEAKRILGGESFDKFLTVKFNKFAKPSDDNGPEAVEMAFKVYD